MTSKILMAFPGPLIKKMLWDRPEFVLFDEAGWWIMDGASCTRRCIDTFAFDVDWSSQLNATDLLSTLKEWSPVWFRWIAHADQYELLYREALIYVLHAKQALLDLGITHVIFHTGISHHLDSSLLETACAELQVPQLFLYAGTITGRLQPLLQSQSIKDRREAGIAVSDYQAADDVRAFRSNALAGKPPRIGFWNARIHRSFPFGLANAYYLGARQRASQIKARVSRMRTRTSSFLEQFEPLRSADFVRLITNQKRALKHFRQRVSPDSLPGILRRMSAPVVLLAAHYQPEASSFPEGADLHNHIDIVVRLRGLGYAGPILYKEHIASTHYFSPIIHQTRVGICRSVSYYQRLEELGCVFVDPLPLMPMDVEINERFVPVTITGSIALERSLAGLRTIVTGYPWYKGLPGTINLSSVASLRGTELASLGASDTIAEESFAFLDAMLSRKTILNAPGIGCG
jgi:hypothetical protein